jgi:diamine N-acetyltransferase
MSTGSTSAPPARLALRPTMLSDLEFVVAVETDAANLPFITPWDRTQHEGAVRFPDFRHFIVEAGPDFTRAGFVILQGHGLGRATVRELKRLAFRDLQAHRFWLDVKLLNERAFALYKSEGFVEEGRLRESVRLDSRGADGYDSLIVMSLLDREYQARLALGLELPA